MASKPATPASTDAGIMVPLTEEKVPLHGIIAKQKSLDELYEEIDTEDLSTVKGVDNQIDGFIKKHYEARDANIDQIAEILNWEPMDVTRRLKDLGYSFAEGS